MAIDLSLYYSLMLLGLVSFVGGLIVTFMYSFFRKNITGDKMRISQGDVIAQAVITQYSEKVEKYSRTITELKARIELLEALNGSESHIKVPVYSKQDIATDSSDVIQSRDNYNNFTRKSNSNNSDSEIIQHYGSDVKDDNVKNNNGSIDKVTRPSLKQEIFEKDETINEYQKSTVQDAVFISRNGTNDYILKIIAEKPRTSREIQHAVGRTREHTSRLMKKLFESGLVTRDTKSKPFRYMITQQGQRQLESRVVQHQHEQMTEHGEKMVKKKPAV